MKRTLFWCGLWFVVMVHFSVPAHASLQGLQRFFAEVATLQAHFTQTVRDEDGMLLEQSDGIFSLSRPGKFRWDYSSGFASEGRGTQIVADGEYLLMYDPDLEQLSQRSLADALGQVPSLLLAQAQADIAPHFEVTELGLTDGLTWVALKPRDPEAAYQQLMVGFVENRINQIVLLDGLGNETRLQLSELRENVPLGANRFAFIPPPGTDILFQ